MTARSAVLTALLTAASGAGAQLLPGTVSSVRQEPIFAALTPVSQNELLILNGSLFNATFANPGRGTLTLKGPHEQFINQAILTGPSPVPLYTAAALLTGDPQAELMMRRPPNARSGTRESPGAPFTVYTTARYVARLTKDSGGYTLNVAVKVHPPTHFSADAPVLHPGKPGGGTIRIFTDHGCPYCAGLMRAALPVWKRLFPAARITSHAAYNVSTHPGSDRAALYAWCVSRLTPATFTTFDDVLYRNTSWLGRKADPVLRALAVKVNPKTDLGRLNTCVTGDTAKGALKLMRQQATALGVDGTPTVFVNGVALNNWADNAEIKRLLALKQTRTP